MLEPMCGQSQRGQQEAGEWEGIGHFVWIGLVLLSNAPFSVLVFFNVFFIITPPPERRPFRFLFSYFSLPAIKF